MADSDLLDVVPTRAALLRKGNAPEFKATVFVDPKHNKIPNTLREVTSSTTRGGTGEHDEFGEFNGNRRKPKRDELEFDIKRARHDVINFALAGTSLTKNKKKAQVLQAIKLGAKAPKKVCKNYKELLGEKKRLKDIREERIKFHQLGKNQTGLAAVKCRAKNAKAVANKQAKLPIDGISKHYGVVNPKLSKKKK